MSVPEPRALPDRRWLSLLLPILLLGCGPSVAVDDVRLRCSPGTCRVVFFVEVREPQAEDVEFEVSVLSQKPGTSTLVTAGSTRVRLRLTEGERKRVEATVATGVLRGNKAVVRRIRS